MGEAQLPLVGIKVLDLTRTRAEPTAVRQLADWGADVVQAEMPVERDGQEGITGERYPGVKHGLGPSRLG